MAALKIPLKIQPPIAKITTSEMSPRMIFARRLIGVVRSGFPHFGHE
jgi:hypothetical protein